ncbi:hypothetical protein KOI35_15035 [Actinoplanes bogorensis]|uniref:Uncharacterized protein n=1 Tax=Paractinoplanes bogorensis TaxID=1610840 RepID=A0ABS5YS09_9ACTN|nr:hypothetical protein [Actinoplanes bogorensis]MBU2664815.1 hypothetical protein [Actinoplanes bogorensis]
MNETEILALLVALLVAILAGLAAGFLSWRSGRPVPSAALVGGGAALTFLAVYFAAVSAYR